jgi:hypothetical protein
MTEEVLGREVEKLPVEAAQRALQTRLPEAPDG